MLAARIALALVAGVQAASGAGCFQSTSLRAVSILPPQTGALSLMAMPRLVLRGGEGEASAEPAADEKKGFDLDGWKRLYSNAEDTASIMGQFWESYDKEGWSIWFTEYKNNEDYERRMLANNLIGGWFQRLDATGTRKVAFGNVHVFGDEPKLEMAGCWLVKGHEIPQEFKEAVDFEQWDWIKVDTEDAAMRKVVENYMTWEGDFGKGRKWAAGKTYK